MSDEDYGFEYSDDDQEEDDVNIENTYYNSKGMLADGDPEGALAGFEEARAPPVSVALARRLTASPQRRWCRWRRTNGWDNATFFIWFWWSCSRI